MPKNNTFGQRITIAREIHGLSQTKLAQKAGTTPSRICNLEAGRNSPSMDLAVKIADALNVSLDYLAGRCDGDAEMMRRAAIVAQIAELKAQL